LGVWALSSREKVAVLGGGPAGIAAAYELSATPELCERFEVTVYQPGWRLGGKCASGRKRSQSQRLEEHGLHLWFGFYDNAFRMMRATYKALERPASHPLATFGKAFERCDELVLYDRQGDAWHAIPFKWPRNDQHPGEDYPLPDIFEIAFRACDWAVSTWTALCADLVEGEEGPTRKRPGYLIDLANAALLSAGLDSERGGEHLLHLAHHLTRAYRLIGDVPVPQPLPGAGRLANVARRYALRSVALLVSRFRDWMWLRLASTIERQPDARMFFTMFDTFAAALTGLVVDGVLERGWDAINDRDLCDWLTAHGAKEITVGASPRERSPLLRALYDVAFAYPGGVIDAANAAAGTALNDLLRLAFSCRGSLFYRMAAGFGETIFVPLYELLQRRGVRFEFFHAATDLQLSQDGALIEQLRVVPQVALAKGPYDPLVEAGGLRCWPSEPLWEQLRDGEQHRRGAVNFELQVNPLRRRARTLKRGKDFDAVVLAIPIGALRPICGEIARRHEPFERMLGSSATVATQAIQLWTTKSPRALGWKHSNRAITGSYVEPLSTACDMSHLIEREGWAQSQRPAGLAYLCGVLEEQAGDTPESAAERVLENARAFIQRDLATLWPRAGRVGASVDWGVLAATRSNGPARLEAQYCRANTTGSERYVLTPAGSVADRLHADGSGVDNLMLAGDWTRNGLDAGCVEAAVMSGMQAARALIGHDRRFRGESQRWLTDRREHRSVS
jgi:uncharacterized protein with NAD-binding domain and iron-sulfur cluster